MDLAPFSLLLVSLGAAVAPWHCPRLWPRDRILGQQAWVMGVHGEPCSQESPEKRAGWGTKMTRTPRAEARSVVEWRKN